MTNDTIHADNSAIVLCADSLNRRYATTTRTAINDYHAHSAIVALYPLYGGVCIAHGHMVYVSRDSLVSRLYKRVVGAMFHVVLIAVDLSPIGLFHALILR